MYTATICPTITLYLVTIKSPYTKAYCSENPFTDEAHGGAKGALIQFILVVLVSDFFEWGYHRLGHVFSNFWSVHKHHHVFFNPSPFAVIADEYVDQFVRAAPLLVFPMLVPINMDIMFFTYALFFYVYGVYLHWGYEFDFLDAHNPIINTSFQHYCHHAKAILNKPYHCGFYFKIWDQIMHQISGHGIYPRERCFCAKCEREKGLRSLEAFKKVEIPDYSCLFTLDFWMKPGTFSGTSAKDTNDVLTEEEKFFASKKSK